MKNLSKLNPKTKILTLITWTVVLLLLTFLVNGLVVKLTKVDTFADYGTKPYDDTLSLSVGMKEDRKSSLYTSNQNNDMETSKYTFYVYITKPNQVGYTLKVKYMSCHLTVKTENAEYVYKNNDKGDISYTSPSYALRTTQTYFTFSNILTKKIKNKTASVTSSDETPQEIYIKLYYYLETTDNKTSNIEKEEKIIEYKTKISNVEKLDYKTSDVRKADLTDTSKRGNIETKSNEYFDLNIIYDEGLQTSTDRNYFEDKFTINLNLNTTNLGDKAIKNMKIDLVGKLKNDPSDENEQFSNQVYLASYHGALPKIAEFRKIDATVDTRYQLEEIYVFATITLTNGKKETSAFKINVEDLAPIVSEPESN